MTVDPLEQTAIDRVVTSLIAEFAATRSAEEVRAAVARARDELADAPIRTFVPTLVERSARRRLMEIS